MFTWRAIIPLFAITALYSFAPEAAQAQNGFVSCEGTWNDPCDFCDLVSTARNILDFLITIAVIIAVIIIVFAGLRLTTSAGNVAAKDAAKGYMTNAIIGLILVLVSWLIIDTIMKVLVDQEVGAGGQDFGVWHRIECRDQPTPREVGMQVEIMACSQLEDSDFDCVPQIDDCVDDGGTVFFRGESEIECRYSSLDRPNPGNLPDDAVCDPDVVGQYFAGQDVNDARCVISEESTCGTDNVSLTDTMNDGRAFSFGPMQVNLTVHDLNIPECTSISDRGQLNCTNAFAGSNFDARVVDESLYAECARVAQDTNCNLSYGRQLRDDDINGWCHWSVARKCGLPC